MSFASGEVEGVRPGVTAARGEQGEGGNSVANGDGERRCKRRFNQQRDQGVTMSRGSVRGCGRRVSWRWSRKRRKRRACLRGRGLFDSLQMLVCGMELLACSSRSLTCHTLIGVK